MKVYHGSKIAVPKPDLRHSRKGIDFGRGFYLTESESMSCKWAANKMSGNVVNVYDLDLRGLGIVRFGLDEQWLDYVSANRGFADIEYDESDVDAIIGPTADDKLFDTLTAYWDGTLDKEQAIRYLTVAGFADQIALKSEMALSHLSFVETKQLDTREVEHWRTQAAKERDEARKRLEEFRRQERGGQYLPKTPKAMQLEVRFEEEYGR